MGAWLQHRGFDVLVLAAEECQPPSESFPGVKVIRFPLGDDGQPWSPHKLAALRRLSTWLAQSVAAGHRVLVTCHKGLNRSGIIVAATIMQMTGAPALDVIAMMRRQRDPEVLFNPVFVNLLKTEVTRWTASQRPSLAAVSLTRAEMRRYPWRR